MTSRPASLSRTLLPLSIPLITLATVGGIFAAIKPNVIASALKSPQAIVITLAVVAVTVLLTVGLSKVSHRNWVGVGAGLIPVLAFLAFNIIPTTQSSTLNEDLPIAGATSMPMAMAQHDSPKTTRPTSPDQPPQPQILARGDLAGIDHDAAGKALLVQLPDQQLIVRLEDFSVEPGPDYFVYLVPQGETEPDNGIRLDRLKATKGNQNYPAPANIEPNEQYSMLIWCRAFAVPVAEAPLL